MQKYPITDVAPSIALLRTLVAFRTVSRDSNLELIQFASEHFKEFGASVRLTYDDERNKANLFATFGPGFENGIVLSGHTDVVPVEGQAWETDPFTLVEKDGKLYGRGTSDMKSFIAVAFALAPEFARRNLNKPVHFALSYDEEVGCIGVGRMIADLCQAGIRPASCIVGEPTQMQPVIAHKGKHAYRCSVRGYACHSAYASSGVNAVEAAAEAVAFLKRLARRHRDEGPYDANFDIAYTTVHTGVIHGGHALNIVPDECVFDFEFRHLPGDDPGALIKEFKDYIAQRLEPEMQEVRPDAGFTITQLSALPALHNSAEAGIVALVQELSGQQELAKVSFGTEASHFQRAGIPTVVCGPGSITEAHKANEFVTLEQVIECEQFMRRLLDHVCAAARS